MALSSAGRAELELVSYACVDGAFPSVGAAHPPAIRLERALRDLHGFAPIGARDARPWLDHGRWPVRHPLGVAEANSAEPKPYAFLGAEGEGLHQIPVGPVHAGIIEPGHFRFHANGETVVRLEERLGYVHKGVDGLMSGASLTRGAQLACRVSGDSTVAYPIAFARAAEAALGIAVPRRAVWLRALMAELERLANHLGDIGAICNDASFALMHAHCGMLRERVLRAAEAAFGHRLMMDAVVPGGVTADLTRSVRRRGLRALAARSASGFRGWSNSTTTPPRCRIAPFERACSMRDLAQRFGAGGFVGRASGRAFDARRDHPYRALRRTALRRADAARRRRQCARLGAHPRGRGRALQLVDADCRSPAAGPVRVELRAERRARRGRRAGRGLPRRRFRLAPPRRRRNRRALSPARSVVVPVAAAGGGDRGQHRRGLSALQQIVQLLLFRGTISG